MIQQYNAKAQISFTERELQLLIDALDCVNPDNDQLRNKRDMLCGRLVKEAALLREFINLVETTGRKLLREFKQDLEE